MALNITKPAAHPLLERPPGCPLPHQNHPLHVSGDKVRRYSKRRQPTALNFSASPLVYHVVGCVSLTPLLKQSREVTPERGGGGM